VADRDLTPEEQQDLLDRVRALQMRHTAAHLQLAAALVDTTIAVRGFVRVVQAVEAAQFADLRTHPDVLELDVATDAWYPGKA
jgi:hypothetical protein